MIDVLGRSRASRTPGCSAIFASALPGISHCTDPSSESALSVSARGAASGPGGAAADAVAAAKQRAKLTSIVDPARNIGLDIEVATLPDRWISRRWTHRPGRPTILTQ